MELIIAVLFGSIVSLATHGTVHQKDCQARNNEPSACVTSKVLEDIGNISITVKK